MQRKYYIIIACMACTIICLFYIIISYCNINEYRGINNGAVKYSLHLEDMIKAKEEYNREHGIKEKEFEVTDDVAIDIGNAAIKAFFGEDAIKYSTYSLTYYKNDGIYKFARIPNSVRVMNGFGWDYAVAIRKEDGAILRVWFEG